MTFTAEQKHKCAVREVVYRRRVFERLIDSGKMTREKADVEIALMEAIAADYAAIAEREKRAEELPL